ncbi:hypothetical protein QBC47DRAFT_187621 [Echria macrotheca]|uniref:Uncharacterized protein n=1 Tax=Echria macrotheca TaxID=438768 RepID=A0AAJ0BEK7_9PEZI|nr:hypothetical protein QBC47DRAFT_187621 [Echria macrotheca]
MAQLPQPATVQVDLTPVNIVTPPATAVLTTSNHVAQPSSTFAGTGQLLSQSDCSSTSYTLVKAETVVYYAAFVGCDASRPQCCPWSVSVDGSATTTGALDEGNRVAGGPGQFPIPANGIQALLNRCPDDYYSVSSQCCPNGYYKFTSRIAFQTPCFSFLKTPIKPPALTAGLAGNPTDTNLPTSAVVNMAWAMGFNVSDAAQPPLSKGAAIGVGVGAGVFGLGLIALAVFVCLRVRRNKKQALEGGAGPGQAQQPGMGQVAAAQGTMYQQGYHQAAPGSPPVSSPPLPSPPLSDGGSAGAYPFQGQYAPVPYKGHSRGYSDVSEAGWSQGSSEYPTQGYRQEGYQGYQGGQEQMQYQQAGQYGGYHRSELSGGQQ